MERKNAVHKFYCSAIVLRNTLEKANNPLHIEHYPQGETWQWRHHAVGMPFFSGDSEGGWS